MGGWVGCGVEEGEKRAIRLCETGQLPQLVTGG